MESFFRGVDLVKRKRSAEDILLNANPFLQSVMTVDSEPKKAKLDPTALLSQYYTMNGAAMVAAQPQALHHYAQQMSSCSTSSTQPPPPVSQQKSRVVHVRNIPPDMVDLELMQLCVPYGSVSNFMMLKGKSQAFVEYDDERSAANFVNTMTNIPIQIRGRTVFAQFSTHQQLKFENKRKPQENGSSGEETRELQETETAVQSASGMPTTVDISVLTQQAPNAVLRVIIENMIYPVTLEVLHTLFSRYGKVLRIITFNKNSTFQALVQMSESSSAQLAKLHLENQNVYNGCRCCTLRIDFSKLSTLNVKYNNDKSRDYTNPSLPSGDLTLEQTLGGLAGIPGLQALLPTASPYSFAFGANPAAAFLPQQPAEAASASLSPFLPSLSALSGASLTAGSPQLRFPINLLGLTSVLLVSNLDENKVTPDSLFTLFGVYGDVVRVKILYNKKDNALIQYAEPQQAQLALQHLDKVRWHDKVVRVAPSKHNNVQLPKEGQPDAGLTRDYSHSQLHRFKKPGSKNYMNIYAPSSTLHLSNIPTGVTEETLVEAFTAAGYSVKAFKFFPKDHKMALLQLEDIETAIDALINLHNYKLAENAHLRVSFSKAGI